MAAISGRVQLEGMAMETNQYRTAGWLSLAAGIIFPLGFVVGIIQGVIQAAAFGYRGPIVGPSDLMFVCVTAIEVYTLLMFRKLLNERFEFHEVDTLILVAIAWSVLFQVGGIVLKLLTLTVLPYSAATMLMLYLPFMVVAMVSAGIINIMIGIKLIKIKDSFSDLLKAYVYLVLVSGLLQVTVFLSIFALVLFPIMMVMLAMIFLREKEEVEFV